MASFKQFKRRPKAKVSFRFNRQPITTNEAGALVLHGFRIQRKESKILGDKIQGRMGKKANTIVGSHVQAVIIGIQQVTQKGLRGAAGRPVKQPKGSKKKTGFRGRRSVTFRISNAGTGIGGRAGSVTIGLNWAPLSEQYQLRKFNENAVGKGRFYRYRGGLGDAMGNVKGPQATTKVVPVTDSGKGARKKITFRIETDPNIDALPDPLQGLMRRSFLEGKPIRDGRGVPNISDPKGLDLLYMLEVSGVGRHGGVTRPFITKLSAALGRKARQKLRNLTF